MSPGGIAVTVILLVAIGWPVLRAIAGEERRKRAAWPRAQAIRAHHAFGCVECACSYESPASLSRHHAAQHTDETLVLNRMAAARKPVERVRRVSKKRPRVARGAA